MTGDRTVRPLSACERWYWICDQFSTLNVISRVRVRGALPAEVLRRGLDALQERHPLLQRAIEEDPDGTNPRWVTAPGRRIPLRAVLAQQNGQWIAEVNERELLERVNSATGPLIRAVVVSESEDVHDLLVVVPHIIADGTTVLSLARQWLELTADPTAVAPMRELPPPEDLVPAAHRGEPGAGRLAEQTERDQALLAELTPGRVLPTAPVALEARRTQLLHRELTGEQLAVLVDECRRQRVSVHGILTAALTLAAARDSADTARHFTVGSPIDFRPELAPPVSPDEVGSYVATVPSMVDTSLPVWDLARAISQDLVARKAFGDHFCLVTMVVGGCPQSVTDARPFMQLMEAEGPINLCSSNVGRYPFPDHIGQWQASDAQFLTGISVNGYFVATINTSHHKLFWNFTYVADAVPDERATRLADSCLQILASALSDSADLPITEVRVPS